MGILRENHFRLDTLRKTGLFPSLWSGELQAGCGAGAAIKMTEETHNLCDLKTRFVLLHARKKSTKVTRVWQTTQYLLCTFSFISLCIRRTGFWGVESS
jgi:hypothetical protein